MSVRERQPLRVLGDGTIADDFHDQVRRPLQFHVTVRFAACALHEANATRVQGVVGNVNNVGLGGEIRAGAGNPRPVAEKMARPGQLEDAP